MVAVVAGNGLGLLNTSLNILGESGVLMRCTCIFRRSTCICGNPPEARRIGQSLFGTGHAFVNAVSGNLVLQMQDEQLAGRGLDLYALRTYKRSRKLFDRLRTLPLTVLAIGKDKKGGRGDAVVDKQGPRTGRDKGADGKFAESAPSICPPKGGGAIRGIGERFAANYGSDSGTGPFRLGWHLSLPSIVRKTDKGPPRYRDAEGSDVFILSGAEDAGGTVDVRV